MTASKPLVTGATPGSIATDRKSFSVAKIEKGLIRAK